MASVRVADHRLLALSVLLLSGCSSTDQGAPGGDRSTLAQAQVISLNEADVAALVEDYLFKRTDDAESRRIHDTVRALDRESAQLFFRIALERGNPTEEQRALAIVAMNYASERGLSMLDLTPEDGREITARFTGLPAEEIPHETSSTEGPEVGGASRQSCAWYEASCPYTSSWNSSVGLTICDGGCTVGDYWDNVGNAPCEAVACDTRLRFPRSSASYIDGATSAADCVISYYGALSKYSSGGYTYVGYGTGGPVYCLFFPGNPAGYFTVK